jgi:hypothetical protein
MCTEWWPGTSDGPSATRLFQASWIARSSSSELDSTVTAWSTVRPASPSRRAGGGEGGNLGADGGSADIPSEGRVSTTVACNSPAESVVVGDVTTAGEAGPAAAGPMLPSWSMSTVGRSSTTIGGHLTPWIAFGGSLHWWYGWLPKHLRQTWARLHWLFRQRSLGLFQAKQMGRPSGVSRAREGSADPPLPPLPLHFPFPLPFPPPP